MSPIPSAGDNNKPPRRTICSTYTTIENLVKIAEDRNENLGKDLFWINSPTIRGTPLLRVPNLETDNIDTPQTYESVVGIDWNSFGIKFQKGWKLKESEPTPVATQPYVVRIDMTSMYNTFCDNLRSNFVLSTNYLWNPSV